MGLVRLVYHSRSRLDLQLRPAADQVAEILALSVANNQRDDITGGLIHDAKWFVQILEGSEQSVSRAFERILRDPRHGAVALVNMQPIGVRRFGLWWMASAGRGKDNAHVFRQYTESDHFDPQQISSERLIDLTDAAVRYATRRGRKPAATRWRRAGRRVNRSR